jgi:hypothetical protein
LKTYCKFYSNFSKIGLKIYYFVNIPKRRKKAKWPNHFISGKQFQEGQMATLIRKVNEFVPCYFAVAVDRKFLFFLNCEEKICRNLSIGQNLNRFYSAIISSTHPTNIFTNFFMIFQHWVQILKSFRPAFLNRRDASRYRDLEAFLPGLEILLKLDIY